jgi:hypothetical protein
MQPVKHVATKLRLAIATLGVLAGCNTDAGTAPASSSEEAAPVVTSIESVDPIREWFNASVDRPRFITILSPT